jgi:nucleoside phosphorylase
MTKVSNKKKGKKKEEQLPYRVGIVTALEIEYAAVKALLDNITDYSVPGQGAGRRYLLGETPAIDGGKHSVVLALAGQGNNIAAARATLLLEHFPNVKSIIMVGIAGGIPNPTKVDEHVRLGDVVISDKKGVVQYDFTKESFEGIIYRNPARPPSARLVEAVSLLVAGQLEGNCPWLKFITPTLEKLQARRPGARTDILADSTNPEMIIRHPRDPKRFLGQPKVFTGPIASANILLKRPLKRDALRDKFGTKAVEMEGSGIADATWIHETGYLVVRGICDYCDKNKGDAWQLYAAIVAAAYTRALLESMPSQDEPQTTAYQITDAGSGRKGGPIQEAFIKAAVEGHPYTGGTDQEKKNVDLRDRITTELELRSRDIRTDDLPNFIGDVESYLSFKVRAELMSILHSSIPNAKTSQGNHTIQIQGSIYILDVEPTLDAHSTIRVLFRPATSQRGGWPQTQLRSKIDGYGQISKLWISAPESLSGYIDSLAQTAQCVYETGYAWLLEFCRHALTRLTDSLSMELYGYLRRIFSSSQNPALAELVYLGLVGSSGVIYLFDQMTAEKVITTIQGGNKQLPLSPLVLSVELLTRAVDFDKSFNKEAIAHSDGLNVELSDARYFEELPIYDIAERTLFGTTGICFFPLTAIGGQYLSSWFPTSVRDDVLPLLNKHKVHFGEILYRHKGRVRRIWKSSLKKARGNIFTKVAAKFSAEFMKQWFGAH